MSEFDPSRRKLLLTGGASVALGLAGTRAQAQAEAKPWGAGKTSIWSTDPEEIREDRTRKQRMAWWHQAAFGMFIHFGPYSVLGHGEWAINREGIPIADYERYGREFHPAEGCFTEWAKLAKAAGQRYMVMTAKHHDGFCNWNSKLTDWCATKQGPKRDLVGEYVEAARKEGVGVGLYYSLMDWHHPDGATCYENEDARRRFVDYTHGLVREILSNYGKIDILWWDVPWPLDATGWESERLNKMVFDLQPHIIVNDRDRLPGDFSTPERNIVPAAGGRAWETCMTLNNNWGYTKGDNGWKNAQTVIYQLITCVRDGGNYLLNIGPRGNGSVPEPSRDILRQVGAWIERNRESIFDTDHCQIKQTNISIYTRKGNTLYMHIFAWTGDYAAIAGLQTKVLSARFLVTGKPIRFKQSKLAVRFLDLPMEAPDSPMTTIAVECASEPTQNTPWARVLNEPRSTV